MAYSTVLLHESTDDRLLQGIDSLRIFVRILDRLNGVGRNRGEGKTENNSRRGKETRKCNVVRMVRMRVSISRFR